MRPATALAFLAPAENACEHGTMQVFLFVLTATILEAVGDAVIRIALHHPTLRLRIAFFFLGAALLTGYGTSLNLAPVEFATVTGMYVATLFVVFQITNYFIFRTAPTPPILIGGTLIVLGGLVIALWR
jgi:small multidrug resistance family-3 protein